MRPLITIRRQGKFNVPNLIASNQCGRPRQTEFNYAVEITVDTLDAQGFVCDNFNVPKSFTDKFAEGYWLASCEQLAGGAIYLMRGLCGNRALKIAVTVSPIVEAGVTVTWERGWDMPDFFPIRVDPNTPGIVLARDIAAREAAATVEPFSDVQAKRRGRPKGSKNKAK